MTFEQWFAKPDPERDDCSPQDDYLTGLDKREILYMLENAYEAGWNSCRDHWGGMEYKETVSHNQMKEDF